MDLRKVLTQLHAELADLDAAILSLERLQQESIERRRGRTGKLPESFRRRGRPREHAGIANSAAKAHPDAAD